MNILSTSCQKLVCLSKSIYISAACLYRFILLRSNPLCVQIVYFISISTLGFGFLKALKPLGQTQKNLDLFFTSVSSTTVSSMVTVEMGIFSNTQLIIITILMFIGGEVFTSLVGLFFIRSRLKIDLDKIASSHARLASRNPFIIVDRFHLEDEMVTNEVHKHESLSTTNENLRYLSMKYLGYVVIGYILFLHVIGVIGVSLYLTIIPSTKQLLKNKGLKMLTFSVFTIVSSFSSCGFVPTNENMIDFRKNSGLLLMLIPQLLLGNTFYPPCLRLCICGLGKFYKKRECRYLLKHSEKVGYKHLLQRKHTIFLVATNCGLIVVQVTLFCVMDWNSKGLKGLNFYQKLIGVLFQSVNSRHAGTSIVDISILSQAILVLFVVMMYLPPYTSFLPLKYDGKISENSKKMKKRRGKVTENLIFSQLSYLVIFIILVCITERKKLKEDPLNFNVLNIVVEVISAYGNVGFSTGYSCELQLHPETNCENKWIGFVGKWSDEGKIILIFVMLFGRLKKFNMDGGKAWKLH
ncbi:probable cation transporter HKT6 isoform X2 [Medicago truncatula]|uniref:High-affinity potassium transporter n=2 Tax=Medicago truncatula TaxID=3880 RepID=G7KJW5_MEDTR|nr:probable cation transporter HKT6 isoform X2 [Medicago truncatula]AES77170.2 high-affinity potassium transporter [Medicago truncatula]